MNILCVQFNSIWKNKKLNFELISTILESHKIDNGSLIILPEMFATGFCLDPKFTTIDEPQQTESYLSNLAIKKNSWVMGGMCHPTSKQGFAYNTAVTFSPNGQRISLYKKNFPIPFLGETNCHLPGDQIEIFKINSFNVTPIICYDLRFPELFRKGILSGTDLFIVLGCWPKERIDQWITLLKARSVENQSFVIGVNRTGDDQDLEYGGCSMVISPKGEIISMGDEDSAVIEASISQADVTFWRNQFPCVKEFIQSGGCQL